MGNPKELLEQQGFFLFKSFFNTEDVARIVADAKWVFLQQMIPRSFVRNAEVGEAEFERGLYRYFSEDPEGFINCGKTCQHLISLHRLSLSEGIVEQLEAFGVKRPNICTRPVLFFNSRHVAKTEAYHKSPPHQDWRSMQGSLNAMVVWVPLIDVPKELGALEVIAGSHVRGLRESHEDEWYRSVEGTSDEQYQSVEVNAGDALFFSAFLLHRSGNNVTENIRWSCHFRYNDLEESTFIQRKYPNPYIYKPQQELVTKDFPSLDKLRELFPAAAREERSAALEH